MQLTDMQKGALLAAGVAAMIVAGILIYYNLRITTSGVVASVGLEVYKDQSLTTRLNSVDWGIVYPGSNRSVPCWIKYTGNVNASLAFTAENWDPPEASVISFSSDFIPGTMIRPGEVVKVILTIRIPQSVQGITSFRFDIIVTVYNL